MEWQWSQPNRPVSCVGNPSCSDFRSAAALLCPVQKRAFHSTSPLPAPLVHTFFLHPLLTSLLGLGGANAEVPFRSENPTVTNSRHFGQLRVCTLILAHCSKTLEEVWAQHSFQKVSSSAVPSLNRLPGPYDFNLWSQLINCFYLIYLAFIHFCLFFNVFLNFALICLACVYVCELVYVWRSEDSL